MVPLSAQWVAHPDFEFREVLPVVVVRPALQNIALDSSSN